MAQASRRLRKLRRLKRERSLAFRMLDVMVSQRNQARRIAEGLTKQLKTTAEAETLKAVSLQTP